MGPQNAMLWLFLPLYHVVSKARAAGKWLRVSHLIKVAARNGTRAYGAYAVV